MVLVATPRLGALFWGTSLVGDNRRKTDTLRSFNQEDGESIDCFPSGISQNRNLLSCFVSKDYK